MILESGKNRKKIILMVVGIVVVIPCLLIVGRLTHMIAFYTIPTPSNFPTIKSGDYIFASRLVTPERFDFICYKSGRKPGNETYVHRLCGMEGDTIEIRNGDLFVNGTFADKELTLSHIYKISSEDFPKIKNDVPEDGFLGIHTDDSLVAFVSDKIIRDKSIASRRMVHLVEETDASILEKFSARWNQDQFGPIVVPKGKYFVLGDSRHNALDSRYTGFIDGEDYVATVLFR